MLQRDGNPTALGEAIATYGRIFKTLHILSIIDSESYRRSIKGMRNLQEGRHALAEKIFHGRKARTVPTIPGGNGGPNSEHSAWSRNQPLLRSVSPGAKLGLSSHQAGGKK